MRRRIIPNPKPRLRLPDRCDWTHWLLELAERVSYAGHPAHKRNPGDFGLTPPAAPRQGATLCDGVQVFQRAQAEQLLRAGVRAGLISATESNGLPKHVWAVAPNGTPVEAILENRELATYHGYPMLFDEPMREVILDRWRDVGDAG